MDKYAKMKPNFEEMYTYVTAFYTVADIMGKQNNEKGFSI
jgi:hypothetical protein